MTTQLFHLDTIEENPWNERPLDQANVEQIAASILTDGLLQNPVGRLKPGDPTRVQLAYGHHRLAAFRQLLKTHGGEGFELIPVDVREIDDLAMARQAIVENHSRTDPSAIEKARALLRLTKDFSLSQAAAGEVFGLKSQSSVANLLRLLKLPNEIQDLVAKGDLPERLARQLVSIARTMPKDAARIAAQAAKAESTERDAAFEEAFNDTVREKGRWLTNTIWPEDWPAEPIALQGHKSLTEIPSCKGCEFAVRSRFHGAACIRPECYAAKEVEHAWSKAAAAAKKLGIAVGGRDEKVVDLLRIGANPGLVQRALRAKHASLRLIPVPTNDWQLRHMHTGATGHGELSIGTVDRTALEAAFPAPKERAAGTNKPAAPRVSPQASKWEQRRKLSDAILTAAATFLAEALPADSRALTLLWATLCARYVDPKFRQAWEKASTPAARRVVLMRFLLDEMDNLGDWESVEDMRAGLVELAATVKIKLPADWDPTTPKADAKPTKDVPGHTAQRSAVLGTESKLRPAPKPSAAKKISPAPKPITAGVSTGRPSRAAQQRAQAATPAKSAGAGPAGKGGRK